MLHNLQSKSFETRTINLVKWLEESEFEFHLTGSRFFGGVHKNSDYDFFASDSSEIRDFLGSLGFKLEVSAYKDDSLISCVYRVPPSRNLPFDYDESHYPLIDVEKFPVILGEEGFDIQLVKPDMLEIKLFAQKIMKLEFPSGLFGTKDQKMRLWSLAVRAITAWKEGSV